jgi:leader peptidase (prepilin peptidase)/N-methyltransferase
MSGSHVSIIVGTLGGVVAAGYLAGLTRTVPDRAVRKWWRPTRTTPTRAAATAAVAALLGGLAGAAAGDGAVLPALTGFAWLLAPLVVIDVERHRLPDRLVVVAAVELAVLLAVAALVRGAWAPYVRAVEAGAVVGAALLLVAVLARGALGLGDVKLGGVLGGCLGWFGWAQVYVGMLAGFVIGAAVAVVLLVAGRATARSHLAFGPVLVLGAMLTIAGDLGAASTLLG